MTTLREVVAEALYALKALAPGDGMTVDEINGGLDAVQSVILELHEARGPLRDVDVTNDYTAGENERVRVQAGYSVSVTLPNAISVFNGRPCTDYGFKAVTDAPAGSTGIADGLTWRQPRDGTRIEVVGTTQGLYFYRADQNAWVQADQRAIDDLMPLNSRYKGALGALVARRLIDTWPGLFEPTPSLAARIARANSQLLLRSGVARSAAVGEYF